MAFEALALNKVGKSGYGLRNFERGNIWEQGVDRWVHFVAWVPEGAQAQVVKLFIEVDVDGESGGRAIPTGVTAGIRVGGGEGEKACEKAKRGA